VIFNILDHFYPAEVLGEDRQKGELGRDEGPQQQVTRPGRIGMKRRYSRSGLDRELAPSVLVMALEKRPRYAPPSRTSPNLLQKVNHGIKG